jgi:hypothetical protein
MERPERNRRGMQQRSGLAATISESLDAEQSIRGCTGTKFHPSRDGLLAAVNAA